jgi:hypothetical protein
VVHVHGAWRGRPRVTTWGSRKRIGTASRSARSFLVADATRGRVMRLRVRAVDTSGNHGAWATYVVRRR